MKIIVDELNLDKVEKALKEEGYGLYKIEDVYGVCYISIWTNWSAWGGPNGFIVGSLHREATGSVVTRYTLTFTDFHNDMTRAYAVIAKLK